MYKVELYARVRRACMVEGMSTREAARVFGLHPGDGAQDAEYSVPPGYRRQSPPRRPKLDPYRGVIDRILEDDRSLPKKQRHTAKRIYECLRAEHGFGGKYTIVKDYVRERRRRDTGDVRSAVPSRRTCPVRLRPDEGGDRRSGADSPLLRAGPSPQRRMLRQGLPCRDHGGVLRRSRLGVLVPGRRAPEHPVRQHEVGGGEDPGRRSTPAYSRLTTCSRTDSAVQARVTTRASRPGKGNDKGKVEGLVGYARRNFLVPVPSLPSFDALNAHLEERCLERLGETAAWTQGDDKPADGA